MVLPQIECILSWNDFCLHLHFCPNLGHFLSLPFMLLLPVKSHSMLDEAILRPMESSSIYVKFFCTKKDWRNGTIEAQASIKKGKAGTKSKRGTLKCFFPIQEGNRKGKDSQKGRTNCALVTPQSRKTLFYTFLSQRWTGLDLAQVREKGKKKKKKEELLCRLQVWQSPKRVSGFYLFTKHFL